MNFSNLNKSIENRYKNNLNESLKETKKVSKFINKLNESQILSERNWQLTIPGSYRKAIFDAGEEEDFEGVRTALVDICDFVLSHLSEIDENDDKEYVQEEFEDFKEELEYIDIEDEDEANYWLNDLYDLLDNTDIFLGINESLNEEIHPNIKMVQDRYDDAVAKGLEKQAKEILSDNLIDVKKDKCIETSVNSTPGAAYFSLRRLLKESFNDNYIYRSMDSLHELDREIEDYLNQNNFHGFIDLYDIDPNDEPVPSITYHIDGDWKHEHLRFRHLVKGFLNSKNIVHMITEREYPSDSDSYEADYTIHLMKHKDDIDESIDVESAGIRMLPIQAAIKAKNKFNQEAKKYPYWVVETEKWYDPEGLNIEDDKFNIQFAGEYNECIDWISNLINEAKADTDTYEIEEEGKDFVKIYYPHAISKAMFSIKKNENIIKESLNESLPKEIKKDIDRIVKTHGAHNIPKWQIQSIAQDNPEYSKEIWNYVSDLEYPDDEELEESLNDTYNAGDIIQKEDDYRPNTYYGKFEVIREVPKEELINTHWYDIPDRIYEVKNIDSKMFLNELSYINSFRMRPFKELKEDRDIDFSSPIGTSFDYLHEKEAMDYQLIEPLINFLDEIENNFECDITYNFGRRLSDDKMTAGIDVYLSGDFDNEDSEDYWLKKDEEILDRIRDNLPEYGFKFDDSLGYDSDPWKKHVFGNGYHTQIIEIEDVDECLNESTTFKGPNIQTDIYRALITVLGDWEQKAWEEGQDFNPPVELIKKAMSAFEEKYLNKFLTEDVETQKIEPGDCVYLPSKDKYYFVKLKDRGKIIDGKFFHKPIYSLIDENDKVIYRSVEYGNNIWNSLKLHKKKARPEYVLNSWDNPLNGLKEDIYKPTKIYRVTFSFGDYSHESTTVYANKKSEVKKILQNQYGKDVKIHSIELDECLNEERKPKYWNSMFAKKVIDAYENGDLTFDNIKEWDKNYNGGIAPNPPFNTSEILKYYLNHSKNLSEDTIKQNGKWVNKGKEGTHGTFKTKKEADAQRKAIFASGFKG